MSVSMVIVKTLNKGRVQVDERKTVKRANGYPDWEIRHLSVPEENAPSFINLSNKKNKFFGSIGAFTMCAGLFTFIGGVTASLVEGLGLLFGAKIPKKSFFQALTIAVAGLVTGVLLTVGNDKLYKNQRKNLEKKFDVKEMS